MSSTRDKILVIEPNAGVGDLIADSLARRFSARVTLTHVGAKGLEVEMFEPHDAVVVSLALADIVPIELVRQLTALGPRPVILTADRLGVDEALAALRCGVRDILVKPFGVGELLTCVERALEGYRTRRAHLRRYGQMRDLVRRLVRDRRNLNDRLHLVCKDLVGAHRRLVKRVHATEPSNASAPT